jgi:N-acetylglucosamine-6-phosphate deacetylase
MIEMICDKIHLSPPMISLAFTSKQITDIALITDSVSPSGLPDGDYDLGGLPITVADGVARLKSNGALAGSTLKFNFAIRNVSEITGTPLSELVKTTSLNQAKRLGLQGVGELKSGFTADIVLLDAEFNVKTTIVNGKTVFEA